MNIIIRSIDKMLGHLTAKIGLGFLCWFYFRVMHRKDVKIFGKENIPKKGNILYYANHPSMADPFLLLQFLGYPKCVFSPGILPFTPAAKENFFPDNCRKVPLLKEIPFVNDSRLFAWIMKHANAIPVKEGRKDSSALKKMITVINFGGNILMFPEGRRSENPNELNEFKEGLFLLASKAKIVTPIWVKGTDKVFPKGQNWPQWTGNKITVIIGKPIKKKRWKLLFMSKEEKKEYLLKKMRDELLKLRPRRRD